MYLNYFVFAFIKQRWDRDFKSQINYKVDELQASILEAYKVCLLQSYLLIAFFFSIGYKSHAYWSSHGYISLCWNVWQFIQYG
jgi:hypothetical protein